MGRILSHHSPIQPVGRRLLKEPPITSSTMAQASLAPHPTDSIVFHGTVESTYKPRKDNIPNNNYREVSLDGKESIYYIYPEVNQCGHGTPAQLHVKQSSTRQPIKVLPPKSCKGFSKKGIILFETYNYGGQSQNFIDSGLITSFFPPGQSEGVSSLCVIEGTWELLTKDGGKILVKGKSQFEPGFYSDMPHPSDRVYSIRRIR